MAVITSGSSTDQLTVDAVSKAARVTIYNSAGTETALSTSNLATETTLAAIKAQTDQLSFLGGNKLKTNAASPTDVQLVDGSGVTQPVSGSISVSNFPSEQPISGSVTVSNFPATQNVAVVSSVEVEVKNDTDNAIPVSGTFFQATQPISAASLPLPSGASTEATLALIKAKTDNLDVALSTRTKPADTQTISGSVSVSNFPASTEISNDVGNPIYVEDDVTRSTLTGEYITTTFRIAGLASNPHNLLSVWNPVGSGKNLAIRRITLQCDHTTLLATNLNINASHPTAQPTGGTLMTASKFRASQASSIAEVRGAASADGTASAITATAGTRIWSQFGQRAHTLAGWFTTDDLFMIPEHCYYRPIIIAPGDGLLISTSSNGTTGAHYVVNIWWTEYT